MLACELTVDHCSPPDTPPAEAEAIRVRAYFISSVLQWVSHPDTFAGRIIRRQLLSADSSLLNASIAGRAAMP